MEVKQAEQNGKSQGIKKHLHLFLMVLCCLVPIVAIVVLRAIGIQSGFLFFAVVLICPLSMTMMMLFMHKKGDDGGGHHH
jgi:uncharacterized membrane protein